MGSQKAKGVGMLGGTDSGPGGGGMSSPTGGTHFLGG